MRAASVLEVIDTSLWGELSAAVPDLEEHLAQALSPLRREVRPSFEDLLPRLRQAGLPVLVRYARRDPVAMARDRREVAAAVAALPFRFHRVLHAAQRHALDGEVRGTAAWDPHEDADAVRALHGAGLIRALPGEEPPYQGRYALHPDLPPAPEVAYDLAEAVMAPTDDLPAPGRGAVALLHDLASLAAAVEAVRPRRTLTGALTVADARKLGRRLGDRELAAEGRLEGDRWPLALRALEALGAVDTDPLARVLELDPGLDATLRGDTPEAVDRLVHRLVDRDLHTALPAVRAALAQAGEAAVDEVIFLDLLRQQHREVLYPAWREDGALTYPAPGEAAPRPWDDEGWERVEVRTVRILLSRLERLGLLVRAPGVFAGTPDGRRWAGADGLPAPPVWVTSDLEVVVPPDAVTPWERLQLERLGRCVARDVADRYRLERAGLEAWLAFHDLDEALALLHRRSPGVPGAVEDALRTWAASALRITLTRGVLA